jgi:adenosyl cobinamide kinase/adenosyl cobinamide phosphate guanylyltransferase
MLTLVLAGARSGKSAVAEALVAEHGDEVVYVATGVVTDDDMAARIAAHKLRRPPGRSTVETDDLVAAVAGLPAAPVLIDSLGTWVARVEGFAADGAALAAALRARSAPTVVVSEEVGLGVHPETEIGRLWRDALGDVNRAVADVADRVLLVVAGRTLALS